MRTSCAVGALLFGGTLGAAHAGVVGLPGRPGGGPSSWAYLKGVAFDPTSYAYAETTRSGNPTFTPLFLNVPGPWGGYGKLSQFSGSGFSFTRSSEISTSISAVVNQYFQVYGNFRFSLTADLLGDTEVAISHFNANHERLADSIYLSSQGSISLSGTLTDGVNSLGDYYLFHFSMNDRYGDGAHPDDTLFNLSFYPDLTVPGPSAIALFGLAGVMRRRRR
jgi:hypothetical protein